MGKFSKALAVQHEAAVNEALKLIGAHEEGRHKATVHRDAEWNEYRVKLHTDGVHQKESDYHTDDKQDAHDTAKMLVSHSHKKDQAKTESTSVVLKAFNEKTEHYVGHTSSKTGQTYHVNKDNSNKLHNIDHGKHDDVEVVHHDGQKLHVKTLNAHRVLNTIHLHDDEGNHVDSFHHQRE